MTLRTVDGVVIVPSPVNAPAPVAEPVNDVQSVQFIVSARAGASDIAERLAIAIAVDMNDRQLASAFLIRYKERQPCIGDSKASGDFPT